MANMFSRPELRTGETLPTLPYDDPLWHSLTEQLGVWVDPRSQDDALTQYTRYGVGWVERLSDYHDPFHDEKVRDSSIGSLLRKAGLVSAIDPSEPLQDYALVDGGNSARYDIRLSKTAKLLEMGKLVTSEVVVYGGQCPRSDSVDNLGALLKRARAMKGELDDWGEDWLDAELSKTQSVSSRWERPFATERELAFMSLYKLHCRTLLHADVIPRIDPETARIHPSIPLASTAADVFALDDLRITVLNAPAKWREHAGRKLPVEDVT